MVCGLAATSAMACAVPTYFDLRNDTGQQVREVWITDDDAWSRSQPRGNILAPGAAVRLHMPSCLGLYVLTAVLADGTERRHPGLDARRMIGLVLR
jgi:hypothetical protein